MVPRSTTPLFGRRGLWLSAFSTVLFAGTSAFGQGNEVVAVYEGARPKAGSSFQIKDKGYDRPAGVLHFAVPPTEVGTAGLDREFRSFCAEPLAAVTAGRTYRFEVRRADDPGGFGLPDTADGRKEADRRAGYVRELFGRHYAAAVRGDDPVPAAAFQVALWELTQEAEPPAEGQPFTLTGGAFRSRDAGPDGAESAAVAAAAEEMLKSLTGSDAVFYEAEATRGTELVRLQGLANLAGEVAQAQLLLRPNGGFGGVAGGGGIAPNSIALAPPLASPVGGGSGLSAPTGFISPGFGNNGSGSGGGGSGGGGSTTSAGSNLGNTPPVSTTNGTSSTSTTTSTTSTTSTTDTTTNNTSNTSNTNNTSNTSNTNTTTNTDTTTHTNTSNTTNDCQHCPANNNGPGNGETTHTPVPGPPAVVLGLIAIGFFAGRRAFLGRGKA